MAVFPLGALFVSSCDRRASEPVAVSAKGDTEIAAPLSTSITSDAELHRKLLACGVAVGGVLRTSPLSRADLPAACRGLELDAKDLEVLNARALATPIPLDLPKPSTPRPGLLALDIFAGTGCMLRLEDESTVRDLDVAGADAAFLAHVKAELPADTRVTIRADKSALHGCVIHVVDLLKQAGVNKIAFGTSAATKP